MSPLHYVILAAIAGLVFLRPLRLRREPSGSKNRAQVHTQTRPRWHLHLVGFGFVVVFLLGTYVLDWLHVADPVNLAWMGLFIVGWLTVGNILHRRWYR